MWWFLAALVSAGMVYGCSRYLTVANPKDGTPKWAYIGGIIVFAFGAAGAIAVGIGANDTQSGTSIASAPEAAPATAAPPIIAPPPAAAEDQNPAETKPERNSASGRVSMLKQIMSSGGENVQPAQLPNMPKIQEAFLEAVQSGMASYNSAQTDFQSGASRPSRAKAICSILKNTSVSNWVGTVTQVTTNGDGHGVLSVSIATDVVIGTWNNAISDSGSNTLIHPESSLFPILGELQKGDIVRFSGSFFRSRSDCILETSLTLGGSMRAPDFLFRFKSVSKFSG